MKQDRGRLSGSTADGRAHRLDHVCDLLLVAVDHHLHLGVVALKIKAGEQKNIRTLIGAQSAGILGLISTRRLYDSSSSTWPAPVLQSTRLIGWLVVQRCSSICSGGRPHRLGEARLAHPELGLPQPVGDGALGRGRRCRLRFRLRLRPELHGAGMDALRLGGVGGDERADLRKEDGDADRSDVGRLAAHVGAGHHLQRGLPPDELDVVLDEPGAVEDALAARDVELKHGVRARRVLVHLGLADLPAKAAQQ